MAKYLPATVRLWMRALPSFFGKTESVSASVHDLGLMNWKTDKYGKMEFTERFH